MSLLSILGLARAADYAEGQVWKYKTRPGEAASTLQISKMETDPKLGQIFHISVFQVRVKNPQAPTGATTELPHFPVSKQTLDASVTKFVGKSPIKADYQEGYAQWRQAFDAGKAGIFTIPVSEIVQTVESALNP